MAESWRFEIGRKCDLCDGPTLKDAPTLVVDCSWAFSRTEGAITGHAICRFCLADIVAALLRMRSGLPPVNCG